MEEEAEAQGGWTLSMQPLEETSWELNMGVFEPSMRFVSTAHTF